MAKLLGELPHSNHEFSTQPLEIENKNRIEAVAESMSSDKHPEWNEDRELIDHQHLVFAMFDGMGGRVGGEKAASIARRLVEGRMARMSEDATDEEIKSYMIKVLRETSSAIKLVGDTTTDDNYHPSQKEHYPFRGMMTTAVVMKVVEREGRRKGFVANVGDSRLYRYRGGRLEQITLDDTFALLPNMEEQDGRALQQKLSNAQSISSLDSVPNIRYFDRAYMSESEMFQNRHQIPQALGDREPDPTFYSFDIEPGDVFLLTSDGVHDNLIDVRMQNLLGQSYPSDAEMVKAITNEALDVSRSVSDRAKPDDITALLVRFGQIEGDVQSAAVVPKVDSVDVPPPKTIAEATTWHELYAAIDAVGFLQGSARSYPSSELKKIIDDVRMGNNAITEVTNTQNLREKVAALMFEEASSNRLA